MPEENTELKGTQIAAAELIAKGYEVLPLNEKGTKGKEPFNEDWKKIRFRPDDFTPENNIGIKSYNGIVVIDLDCPEAVVMADYFLPGTGAIYGRETAPKSKRIYKSKVQKHLSFNEYVKKTNDKTGKEQIVKGDTLLEIRVNVQDMVPPSFNKDKGEKTEWFTFNPPVDVDEEILEKTAKCLTTAVLLARFYNNAGGRHGWMLSFAGYLRNTGLTETEVKDIVKYGGTCAGDTKVGDRLTEVGTTFAKEGGLSGRKDLLDESSEEFVRSLDKVWGFGNVDIPINVIEEINAYCQVVLLGSNLIVLMEDRDEDDKFLLRFLSFDTMRNYFRENIQVGRSFKKLGAIWLDHLSRKQYQGMALMPGIVNKDYYNLWRGFSVDPIKGDWSLYRQHLEEVIAGGDADHAKWIFNWMASVVQRPQEHGHTAIAIRGGQGVGKSTFCEWFGSLFGDHFVGVHSYQQLTGKFNAHLHNAVLVFGDEAILPNEMKKGVGILRGLITQDKLSIEKKYMDSMSVKNHIHLMLASNAPKFIPAHEEERRFAVFEVSRCHQNDLSFFRSVHKQLFKDGGLSALLYDLKEHDLDWDALRTVPSTSALQEQKELSADIFVIWIQDLLNDGRVCWKEWNKNQNGYIIDKDDLHGKYLQDMKELSINIRLQKGPFYQRMKKILSGWPRDKRIKGKKGALDRRIYVFPPLDETREIFEKFFRAKIIWGEPYSGTEETEKLDF